MPGGQLTVAGQRPDHERKTALGGGVTVNGAKDSTPSTKILSSTLSTTKEFGSVALDCARARSHL
jgi:hypothetical protein